MNFGLIGCPLGHSVSPFIHKKLFSISKIDAFYENYEISPDKLDVKLFMKDFDGINVTIPYKTAVIPALDELCGQAQYLNTVNTIKRDKNKLYGYNTDADGLLKSLEISGISLSGKVLICGAGGTARMIAALAAKSGCDVTLCVRTTGVEKAEKIKSDIKSTMNKGIHITLSDDVCEQYDLLLNATPAGMYPKNIGITPLPKKAIEKMPAVFDAVYNPRETELIKTAKANGARAAYGLPMLVYQAARAQEIWYGADFADGDLDKIICETEKYISENF